jgi:hypothetical protein
MNLPKNFNDLYDLLNKMHLFKNILIINTMNTCLFLYDLCLDKK